MSAGLEVGALACGRGETALFRDLSFAAPAGAVVRILGDNGVGKTTLLRTIAGLLPPISGAIRWQGSTSRSVLLEALCFIDFDNALSGVLTPLENLRALVQIGSGRPIDDARIRTALDALGLKRVAHRPCVRLSSGQRRRVSLARLWLTPAPLWLLDEPAAALDVTARGVLSQRMAEHAEAGGTVVYTTHEALDLGMSRSVSLA